MYLQAVIIANLLADLLAAGGGAHFSASQTRDGARLPSKPRRWSHLTDRPIPQIGVALPPMAYDASIGVSRAGTLRNSASSIMSTFICLARNDRENRSCEDDRNVRNTRLSLFFLLHPLRDCRPPAFESLALANPAVTSFRRSHVSHYHRDNSKYLRTNSYLSLFARQRLRMVSGVTSNKANLVDISTGLRQLRQQQTYVKHMTTNFL